MSCNCGSGCSCGSDCMHSCDGVRVYVNNERPSDLMESSKGACACACGLLARSPPMLCPWCPCVYVCARVPVIASSISTMDG
uniref:Uncharacterized protein n=2 Tax=Triticum urartu TaxID=4572 RepID=A0A8R7JZ98_TRIUA